MAISRQQHNPRSPYVPLRRARRPASRFQNLAYLRLQPNCSRFGNHPDLKSQLTQPEKGVLARLRAKAEQALGGLAKITVIQEAGLDGCLWVIKADNGVRANGLGTSAYVPAEPVPWRPFRPAISRKTWVSQGHKGLNRRVFLIALFI